MIGLRRLGGSFLAALPLAILGSGCGLVLGLGDFTEGGGGSASTGSGQPEPCTPGTQRACLYTGPAGTKDVGPCHAGTQVCNPAGTDFAACVGEVLPATEDCGNDADDDCDGKVNNACPCTPGVAEACYSGPANTKGVGACVAGTHTCNAAGNDFGPCVGQVVPAVDVCSNGLDEDCDGFVCGKTMWARALDRMKINGVGVDGAGNIYVAGALNGPFTMGNVSLDVVGGSGTDVVVLKFDPAGTIIWGKSFGSMSNEVAYAIAVDKAGNVHLTGVVNGPTSFGGDALAAGVFVAKLSPEGAHLWSKACGGSTAQFSQGRGIAVDGTGNVLVTGNFGGSVSCGPGQSGTSSGGNDVFVIRMSGANGGPIWTKAFGDADNQYGYGVAADSNGDALVTGFYSGSIDFGGGSLVAQPGSTSIFVAKLGAAKGAHLWSKGESNSTRGQTIAVDPANNPIFAGTYSGATTFAGKSLAVAGGTTDILFGKLDKDTGNAIWLNGYGGDNGDSADGVAVNAAGRIALGGAFRNSADFGGGALASASLDAAFLATFDASPTQHLWSKQFSSTDLGPNGTHAVAVGPTGEVVAGGQFYGTIDFGDGMSIVSTSSTAFLVRVAP